MATKYTKWQQNVSNVHKIGIPDGHKIYQRAIKYTYVMATICTYKIATKFTNIFHSQGPLKYIRIWHENMQSGNPASLEEI
jgi:hypothetical protein